MTCHTECSWNHERGMHHRSYLTSASREAYAMTMASTDSAQ